MARIRKNWLSPSCELLECSDGFSKIKTGLGTWWIKDEDWYSPDDILIEKPYIQEGDLRYLPGVPYFEFKEASRENVRHSLVCCMAAALIYLKLANIETYEDYLEMLSKHGDGSFRADHRHAFKERGLTFSYTSSIGPLEIEDAIDSGTPVVLHLPHKGSHRKTYGFNYYVIIYGYSSTHWLCHDPCGRLDLLNGMWDTDPRESGEGVLYSRTDGENRFFRGGGASGAGWMNFKEN